MSGKSTFGTVRALASGKFQARYLVNGKQVSAGAHTDVRMVQRRPWHRLERIPKWLLAGR